jgi:hypothetical protein
MGVWSNLSNRVSHAWNAFINLDRRDHMYASGASYSTNPSRGHLRITNDRSIIASIYTRMAIDVAMLVFKHVRLDDKDRYDSDIKSTLNHCLTVEANIDQSAIAFKIDIALTLFDKGVIAIVPVDTTENPNVMSSFDIKTMRVGEVTRWDPEHVVVNAYNERTGMREQIALPKRHTGIVENPLYSVMNEPNGTLQRLTRKLSLLDAVDEQSSSGKLDLIIQLPYVVRSPALRKRAEDRRKDIEFQLKGSQYGIAYTDGTEKITQLNRPSENNLLTQVTYLTELLYNQLGLTEEVMKGTATADVMQNYHNRTIRPIAMAIVEEMRRKFVTKTARSQGQDIMYFRDPFAFISAEQLAELIDKLTRNEVTSANEIRQYLGLPPSKDKKADQLRNSNMPNDKLGLEPGTEPPRELPTKNPLKAIESGKPPLRRIS